MLRTSSVRANMDKEHREQCVKVSKWSSASKGAAF